MTVGRLRNGRLKVSGAAHAVRVHSRLARRIFEAAATRSMRH